MKRQIIQQSKVFKLLKVSQDQKKWFVIVCDPWAIPYYDPMETNRPAVNRLEEVRDFFDPLRNKSGRHGTTWKYKNKKEAEQMFLTATLKWA